jgi:hypothetical protein
VHWTRGIGLLFPRLETTEAKCGAFGLQTKKIQGIVNFAYSAHTKWIYVYILETQSYKKEK